MIFETPDSFLTVFGHPMIELPFVDIQADDDTPGKAHFVYAEPLVAEPHDNWMTQPITWTPLRIQVRRMMKAEDDPAIGAQK